MPFCEMCVCVPLLWCWWERYRSCVLPAAPSVRSPGHFSAALHDLTPSLQLVASALPFPFLSEPPCVRRYDVIQWCLRMKSQVPTSGEKKTRFTFPDSKWYDDTDQDAIGRRDEILPFENLARIWEEGGISALRYTVGPEPVVSPPLGCN